MKFKYFSHVVVILLTLSSCTSITPPSASAPVWQADGRFAVKKQNEGWSGSFEWKKRAKNDYQIHFYGPFGAGNTYLIGHQGVVVWKDNEGSTYASTPEKLVSLKTGFLFPVSYLDDWILGRPAMGKIDNAQYDNKGRLLFFSQAKWSVHYLAYQSVKQGDLPSKIQLNYENLQIKIIIDQWKLNQL